MLMRQQQTKRKGSILVEYALLIAGIAMVSVVGIAVLGHKVSDQYGIMAAIMPGAHPEDNKPVASQQAAFPLDFTGAKITMNGAALVDPAGLDRYAGVIGAGNGELLVAE